MFESVKRDIRDSIRSLGRRPGFTAVAVLSLGVGIGANTAIFSLVNAIILRDTPIERPEELVNIYLDQAAFQYSSLSYPDFEDLRDGTNDVFSGIAAAQFVPVQVDSETGSGGVRVELAEAVTGSYFSLLGIEAELGRMLLQSDDISPGGHPVIVLDHGYCVIGRDLRVGGREYTIVGVAPADFEGSLRGIAPKFMPRS